MAETGMKMDASWEVKRDTVWEESMGKEEYFEKGEGKILNSMLNYLNLDKTRIKTNFLKLYKIWFKFGIEKCFDYFFN